MELKYCHSGRGLKVRLFLGEFPWTVAILKEEQTLDKVLNVYQCGGSLISTGVVLSMS